MIICYSRNFCFIRVPKAASTTCAGAILNSGIIDPIMDFCSLSVEFNQGGEFEKYQGLYHNKCVTPNVFKLLTNKDRTHHSVRQYRELNLIPSNMEVISTIRNPVSRFLSFVKFVYTDADPNAAWDHWLECIKSQRINKTPLMFESQNIYNRMFKPQHWWWEPGTILWPVEYLNWHLTEFFLKHNVHYKPVHHRQSQRPLKCALSQQRQQQIVDHYQQDFVLWESVIAQHKTRHCSHSV